MEQTIIQTMQEYANTFINNNREHFSNLVVARTDADEYLLSVEFFSVPLSQCLCAETGVILEAVKKRQHITHLMHMEWREEEEPSVTIPCGACLERLLLFGDRVNIVLCTEDDQNECFEIRDLFPANWFSLALQDESIIETDESDVETDESDVETDESDVEIDESDVEIRE